MNALQTADQRFAAEAAALAFPLGESIKIGGHYAPVVVDGEHVYVSGQIPRVGDQIVALGAAGDDATLAQAQHGARIAVLRALALVQQAVASLGLVVAVPRMTVYVRSAPGFMQQSEVADAASHLLVAVLGPCGVHSRTSVGLAQLPKGAVVELDLIVRVQTPSLPR